MNQPSTLHEILRQRAERQPARTAYTYLAEDCEPGDGLTYAGLDAAARRVGAALQALGAGGERALLLYPAGLDFIAAFFGCLYGGAVAIPASTPHPARPQLTLPRLRSVVADAQARFVLSTPALLSRLAPLFAEDEVLRGLTWVDTVALEEGLADEWREPRPGDGLAFLQYTSGSTSAPKGVMVSHENLLQNSAYIRDGFGHTPESVAVTWLPAYHDMGLIDGIIQPTFSGFPCHLMPPASFLQRPARWLQAISRHGATHSGGPNFAFELCARKVSAEQRAGLRLGSWRVAYSGAEPVRDETLRRFAETFEPCGFRPSAFYPAYGLAEATLKVSGASGEGAHVTCRVDAASLESNLVADACDGAAGREVRTLVGNGRVTHGTRVRIVNPETLTECGAGSVGEVWVSGPGVARGYWNRPELTEQTFRARLAETGEGPFLRTGDLGFVKDGELFITGRLKDLIIVGGRNHYPQDIELTVEKSHAALRPAHVAAFGVEVGGEERLVVAAEVDPRYRAGDASSAAGRPAVDLKEVTRAVRRAVAEDYGIDIHALALLKVGVIPKTTSGKLRRHACRSGFLEGALETLAAA